MGWVGLGYWKEEEGERGRGRGEMRGCEKRREEEGNAPQRELAGEHATKKLSIYAVSATKNQLSDSNLNCKPLRSGSGNFRPSRKHKFTF